MLLRKMSPADMQWLQDVRKALVHSLATSETSLANILERTRDINDEVRKMAFATVRERVPMDCLR